MHIYRRSGLSWCLAHVPSQIREMETSIIQCTVKNISFPTFPEFFLCSMSEYPPWHLLWVCPFAIVFSRLWHLIGYLIFWIFACRLGKLRITFSSWVSRRWHCVNMLPICVFYLFYLLRVILSQKCGCRLEGCNLGHSCTSTWPGGMECLTCYRIYEVRKPYHIYFKFMREIWKMPNSGKFLLT